MMSAALGEHIRALFWVWRFSKHISCLGNLNDSLWIGRTDLRMDEKIHRFFLPWRFAVSLLMSRQAHFFICKNYVITISQRATGHYTTSISWFSRLQMTMIARLPYFVSFWEIYRYFSIPPLHHFI